MYHWLIKPVLFSFPPEKAHHLTMSLMRFVYRIPGVPFLLRKTFTLRDKRLEREVFGITFPNPVGLAAGFDKDGKYIKQFSSLGFGFIEVGTVTPLSQPGNPRPRLFRLVRSKGLINRMGFNNGGCAALCMRLQKLQGVKCIIGGNIGKNKVTPNAEAKEDYLKCFRMLYPLVDYFVVNVSSPNTPGLRALQQRAPLTELLNTLQEANRNQAVPKPVLLKIAPDLSTGQIDDILDIVRETGISGLIVSNTTISRQGLEESRETVEAMGDGGLSGAPLKSRSTEIIRYIAKKSGGTIPMIGVGGIMTPEDAQEKLEAGASLVQVYTGLVYSGPGLIRQINSAILQSGMSGQA